MSLKQTQESYSTMRKEKQQAKPKTAKRKRNATAVSRSSAQNTDIRNYFVL